MLAPWWKAMISILKSRDITLPTNVGLVKVLVFPVVMYGCESWNIKKAEHQRIDGVELWCWRRAWESLDCKEIQPVHPKGDKSWVFIGRTDAEAETPVLWPPDAKNWLISKDPDAGKDWWWEEKGWQRMRLLDDITESMTWVWVSSGSWWWTREAWGAADHGVTQSQTWLSDWTELDSWGKSVLSQDDFIILIKALQVICTLWIKTLLSEAIS